MPSTLDFLIVTAVVLGNLALATLVYAKNPRNAVNRDFSLFVLSITAWIAFAFIADLQTTQAGQLFYSRLTYASVAVAGIFIVWFTNEFFRFPFGLVSRAGHWIVVVIGLLLATASVATPFLVQDVTRQPWGFDIALGPANLLFVIYVSSTILGFVGTFLFFFRRSKGIARAQLQYLGFGLILSLVANLFVNIVLKTVLDTDKYYRFGNYSFVFFTASTAYAIITKRLFDIRVIIKKTVIYSGLLAFVIGTYSLVIFTLATLLGAIEGISRQTFVPNLIAALFVALGFDPIRRWLIKVTDEYLFVGEYRSEDVLRELSRTLSGVIDLDEALEGMMQILVKNMRLRRVATFVLRRYKEGIEVKRVKQIGYQSTDKLGLAKNDPLIVHFESRLAKPRQVNERRHLAVVTEELSRRIEEGGTPKIVIMIHKRLVELDAAVALPMVVNNQLIGILILSDKLSGDMYSSTDLDFLEIVAHETAGAIEKARFWEEDQLKSEFVSIASHELLTPTSTIQGYLSMILDEGMGRVDPKAKEYLEIVRRTSKRLTDLVQDLLNVSRIESGRMKINPVPMDLLAIIRQVVTELTPQAHAKGLSLHFEDPAHKAMKNGELRMEKNSQFTVFADPERVRQVLVNVIGNGIKYTPKGGVTVYVGRDRQLVSVAIADTGIGMSPEEKKHLFEKFYRIQNEQTQGMTGTGLGLYIAKNIVELMGGKIEAASTPGRGSTFTIFLPSTGAEHLATSTKAKPSMLSSQRMLHKRRKA